MIETTLGIEGMACEMCEAHINESIRKVFSPKKVKANRKKKNCVVLSNEPLDEDLLRKTIADTGYKLTSVSSCEAKAKQGFLGLFSS